MKIQFSIVPLIALVAFLFINPLNTKAQLPGLGISFQAIARDKMENPAKDRKIYVQTSILQNANATNAFYTEIHQSTTDVSGVFTISIGQGSRISGTATNLLSIPWYSGPLVLNLKIAIEPLTPLSSWDYTKEWIDLGTSPFGTVPYALYAGNSTSNDQKLSISDTASMLSPYAKLILSLKTVDTSSLSNRINSKLNMSDTSILLSPYSKQIQVDQLLALKLNIADTALMMSSRIARDTISLSNRINTKLNFIDTAYMLRNYALSSNLSPLAYTANYNDLINKPAVIANIVNTVNGLTGDILINKNTIGIANVDNTTDANKPISILTNAALNNKVDKTAINAANGIPSLDANTKIPSYLLPAISFTSVTIANSSAQMQSIGTTALKGTVAVRTDISRTYVLSVDNSSNVNDWVEILNPGAPVQSVNGKLANVSLTTSDIAEGSNEYFTQSKARLSLSANGPINYNAFSGLFSADTSTSSYSLATRYALQQQNNNTNANLNNKVNLSDTSNMLYPYVRNASNTAVLLTKVNVSDTAIMLASRIQRDTLSLSNRINLKEPTANKSNDINLDAASIIKFPTTNAVKRYVDSVAIVLNSNIVASNSAIVLPDASTSTKGIIQLAGDLSGTATAPIIANNAINTAKIMDGAITNAKLLDAAITDSKIATGISASKVGLSNVNNTSDLNKPISTLTQNALNTKLTSSDTAAMLSNYLTRIQTLGTYKLNISDTTAMLSAYLTSIHSLTTTKLNKTDTTAMLNNYLTGIHNLERIKLNKSDTANMLSAYLSSINSLTTTKLNKADTATMLSNYLTSIHNLGGIKLNSSDTSAMLSAYLTSLNNKEIAANKSNDATLGGNSPSATLYPTQSAVKQYITNNAGSGTVSATTPWSIIGNSGMVDGTNYLGTTDAQPLNIVANNVKSGRIDVVAASGQTSFGYGAGANTLKNTSNLYGTKNTTIGYQSLHNTNYGKENTAIGYQALLNNYTASGSTAIGYQAMFNAYNINTASSYTTNNTAVGYQALLGSATPANNNGISNTAVGHQTMRSNSSGFNNTALGYIALYMNSSGQGNTGIGYSSLYSNTTGLNNTAVGYGLVNNNVGNYNTAAGYNTLSSNFSGNYNTGIGYNADVTGNVSNSTVIGNGATTAAANTIQLGNGSVTNVNTSGSITAGEDVSLKHLKGSSAKPTVTFYGVNVGVTDLVISGTDLGGFIQFTTRASTSKDIGIFSINFAKVYTTSPFVVLTAANAAASTLPVYVNANSTFFYVFPSTVTPTPNTMYSWYYMVVQ
jgi:hypothetical protein